MNGDTATFNTSANASKRLSAWSADTLNYFGGKLRSCLRATGVFLFGCFLLLALFIVQIAALEISDRLAIFPLYGFFFVNLLCVLLLAGFIFFSRIFSSRLSQDYVQTAQVSPTRFRQFWSGLLGAFGNQRVKVQTPSGPKRVAVLLIIKRQASEEPAVKSRAASA